jgi:hypothetical protein
MSSCFELCFKVQVKTREGIYNRIVRTGSFSFHDYKQISKDYDLILNAIEKEEIKFQVIEQIKFNYLSGSNFILSTNFNHFLSEWTLKYNIVNQASPFFLDNNEIKKEDILDIKVVSIGLDHHDGKEWVRNIVL